MSENLKLFVYGSFCEGMVHFNQLEKFIIDKEKAQVKGTVYQLEVGYPVFLSEGSDCIEGQILTLKASKALFALLDEFHGFSVLSPGKSLFWKLEIPAINEVGAVQQVKIYALNPAKMPRGSQRIYKGEWREALSQRPIVSKQLTSKQANYVRLLGRSSGRDIVPIDLGMYRELMKLELIVDKGRRLALTKLGKEVFKYLPEN